MKLRQEAIAMYIVNNDKTYIAKQLMDHYREEHVDDKAYNLFASGEQNHGFIYALTCHFEMAMGFHYKTNGAITITIFANDLDINIEVSKFSNVLTAIASTNKERNNGFECLDYIIEWESGQYDNVGLTKIR